MKQKNSNVVTVKLTDELLKGVKNIAKETNSTVSSIMRGAFCRYFKTEKIILKAKGAKRGLDNLQRIYYPFHPQTALFIHKNAFNDMAAIGEDVESKILKFFNDNIEKEDFTASGRVYDEGDDTFIVFDVNLMKVACLVGANQLTVVSVI